jgi:hypothetical protein
MKGERREVEEPPAGFEATRMRDRSPPVSAAPLFRLCSQDFAGWRARNFHGEDHLCPRDETEYHYGGQSHVPYPGTRAELDDRQWAEYVFYRDNPKGPSVYAQHRLPALAQRPARHRHLRGVRRLPARRATPRAPERCPSARRTGRRQPMTHQHFRLRRGGRIDRDAVLRFTVDGRELTSGSWRRGPTRPLWPPSCGRRLEEARARWWASRRTAPRWSCAARPLGGYWRRAAALAGRRRADVPAIPAGLLRRLSGALAHRRDE